MSKIVFTRVDPFIEAGSGEAYYFTRKGVPYFVECWHTHNSGGQDVYSADTGAAVNEPWVNGKKFEKALDAARDAFNAAWAEHISPEMDAMQATFLALANQEGS